jgi:hypothetical protein
LTAAIRSCYIKTVFQNTAPGGGSGGSGGDRSSVDGDITGRSATPSPLPSGLGLSGDEKASNTAGSASASTAVVVLDDAEKMMKDIEIELGSRLKVMDQFKAEKPDTYAAIEKNVRDLIFRTSYPAQMKREQLSQEQERIRKAEAQADKTIIKRTGKILMVRSHLPGKPKKESTTPRKNQDEEDRLLFLSE